MPLRTGPNLTQRALLLAGIAVAVIVTIVGSRIWQSHNSAMETSSRSELQVAQLLEAGTAATLQSIEILLERAAAEVLAHDRGEGVGDLGQRFVGIADPWDMVYGLSFADADGVVRDLTRREEDGRLHAEHASIDRSHELLQADLSPKASIHISKPYRGALTNQWIIAVTKPVFKPDGSLRGIAIAAVTPSTFMRLFAGLVPSSYVGVALFRTDGTTLFSMPMQEIGRSYRQSRLFDLIAAGEPNGVHRVMPNGTHVERLVAYRSSIQYPFVIAFGINIDTILEPWRRASIALAAAATVGILMIMGLTLWLVRHIAVEEATQAGLLESERRLADSQRIAGVGHFERDIQSNETFWADSMYALHGVTREQYPDGRKALLALMHPDERQDLITNLGRNWVNGPRPGTTERKIVRPDGEVRIIRYDWRVIEPAGSTTPRLFGVAQDVTAIRQTEMALRQNEERLRDLLECSSDFIWETNADGVITLFAGKDIEIFPNPVGHQGREAEARDVGDDSDQAVFHSAVSRQLKFRNLTVPLRGVGDEIRWIRSSGNPVFDAEGKFLGYRGCGADITEMRRQRQIDEERRKAEALGRLASGIAHEINNLLQPIMIYSAFGSGDETSSPGLRRYFLRIGRAAEAATQIVRNVLSFARQRPPSTEAVALADVVRETLDLVGDTLPAGILRIIHPIPSYCIVDVDRSGLAQALTNLITNAAEAMPLGGTITVTAQTVRLAADEAQAMGVVARDYCLMTVADTGPGIPAEQINKVFDPFFTTKPQGKGTGLGLSVVAGHAKSWGGIATVASSPGAGTVFAVYMPLVRPQVMAAQ